MWEILHLPDIVAHLPSINGLFILLSAVLLALIFPCFDLRVGIRKKYVEIISLILDYGNRKLTDSLPNEFHRASEEESNTLPSSESFFNPKLSFEHPYPLEIARDEQDIFHLDDLLPYMVAGMSSVVADSVIPYFIPEKLPMWNLLSRNKTQSYEFLSIPLHIFWIIGFFVRYCILLPFRLMILLIGLVILMVSTSFVGLLTSGPTKRMLNARVSSFCFNFVGGSLALVATFHNRENVPRRGIAVANHTSPLDSLILATDTCYDLVGQSHGGLLGYFMTALSKSSTHIWFERGESKDRAAVLKRISEHVANPDLPPILVFPEGVCVNNTSVMQFKKGTFVLDTEFYPVAIKFDPRFGDAYWWQDSFFGYVISMMTSWAIVCDVYYLPPMRRLQDESPSEFAKRVKSAIAKKGGLVDISWDGFLKSKTVNEESMKLQQSAFASYLLKKETLLPEATDDGIYFTTKASNTIQQSSSPKATMTDDLASHASPTGIGRDVSPPQETESFHRYVSSTLDKSTDTSDLSSYLDSCVSCEKMNSKEASTCSSNVNEVSNFACEAEGVRKRI